MNYGMPAEAKRELQRIEDVLLALLTEDRPVRLGTVWSE